MRHCVHYVGEKSTKTCQDISIYYSLNEVYIRKSCCYTWTVQSILQKFYLVLQLLIFRKNKRISKKSDAGATVSHVRVASRTRAAILYRSILRPRVLILSESLFKREMISNCTCNPTQSIDIFTAYLIK